MSKIYCIILHIDPKNNDRYIISDSEDTINLPNVENNVNLSIDKNVENLISEYYNVNFGWLNYSLYNVYNEDQETQIIYHCFIPFDHKEAKLKGYLCKLTDNLNPKLSKALYLHS